MSNNSISNNYEISNALVVFADVIDSSKFSSVLEMKDYARQLIALQTLFVHIAKRYFPGTRKPYKYSDVAARGDEGTIFIIDPDRKATDLVTQAIRFSLEFKAKWKIDSIHDEENSISPKPMDIGVGIHYGPVAAILNNDNKKVLKIEGYNINYAKRVESCSRLGMHSHVFLSKHAASFLQGESIILRKHRAQLKGIESSEDVYEVKSAFFQNGVPFTKINEEKFYANYFDDWTKLDLVKERWLKSYIVSVIWCRMMDAEPKRRGVHEEAISKISWLRDNEDDPILLYCRAHECKTKKEFTRSMYYLNELIKNHPDFVEARKELVRVCWEIAKLSSEVPELIYARDVAKEFLDKFTAFLTQNEKSSFNDILEEIDSIKQQKALDITSNLS